MISIGLKQVKMRKGRRPQIAPCAQYRVYGLTLIELLITLVILAIVVTLAYPSYQVFLREGRRSDAIASLTQVQLAQAKWRSMQDAYAPDLTQLGWPAPESDSADGYYTIRIELADANGFTAVAVPKPGSPQEGDPCTFRINQDGPVINTEEDRRCWKRDGS